MAATLIVPEPTFVLITAMLASWSGSCSGFWSAPARRRCPRRRRSPIATCRVYTIIVALYREARSVEQLVAALDALDYPREKLQIIFALESDDRETLAALDRLKLPAHFELKFAPASGPRTKPKALNAALAFATGTYTRSTTPRTGRSPTSCAARSRLFAREAGMSPASRRG